MTKNTESSPVNLVLKPSPDSHLQHLIRLARDQRLIEMMGWETYFQDDDIQGFVEALAECTFSYSRPGSPVMLGIYLDEESLPIGYAVIKGMNEALHSAEIGIAILDPEYRFKGYGLTVLELTLAYAQEELSIQTVGAAILETNKASVNMCKTTGFEVVEQRPWQMPDGQLVNMLLLEYHI